MKRNGDRNHAPAPTNRPVRPRRGPALTGAAAVLALVATRPASAVLMYFVADPINPANECPLCPAASGVGAGAFTLDTATGIVTYYIVHNEPGETAAHIHGPAGVCPATAGVLFGLPVGGVKVGSYGPLTAAQQADMQNQLHYVNVHTGLCPAGAIRGQIRRVTTVEACCLQNGTICLDTDRLTCGNIGGARQGPGTACATTDCTQACCVGLSCVTLDPATCVAQGGTPGGNNSNCQPPTACCLAGGCVAADPLCCSLNGGNPLPAGTACAPNPCGGSVEACCLPDGTCVEVPPADCAAAGGRPQGPASTCAQTQCYKNWVIADDFRLEQAPVPIPVTRIRWFGSYLDPAFEPCVLPPCLPNQPIESWLIAIHEDIPPAPCPPPPLGFPPIDLCGTFVPLTGCPISNMAFQPDGSASLYTAIGPVPPAGTRARVCGFIDPNCPACPGTLACLLVNQVLPCDSVSRPGRLLLQYAFDPSTVALQPTPQVGCDGHRTWRYTVDLASGCLMHVNDPSLLVPNGIQPAPGRVYWISIQAVVGHALAPGCTSIATGTQVNRPFWGWHTTPPGYHNIDDAYMGMLGMGCFGEWTYGWMNHLHWSDPPWNQCADDPTKSMDMAFYLLNAPLGGPETILWCQPHEPGPPSGPAPPRLFPPGGHDEFPNTIGDADIDLFGFGSVNNVIMTGPTIVVRTDPYNVGPQDVIDTEILQMNLQGILPPPAPPLQIFLQRSPPPPTSAGQAAGPAGNVFPASSFFDVFVDIDVPAIGVHARTLGPVNMVAPPPGLWEIPPSDATYLSTAPVQLVDRVTLQPIGILRRVRHNTGAYRGGIDIHSDADWGFLPTACVCRGDLNGDGRVNGRDIQRFVNCYINPGCAYTPCPPLPLTCPCECADMNGDGVLTNVDVSLFVSRLLFHPTTLCQ